MFGPAFPILYFIALIAIGIQYFIDRLTLSYFYRLPPKFSEKLTLQTVRIMAIAPLFSLLVSFWLYTNKQMFDNKIDKISSQNELELSHHLFSDFKWKTFPKSHKILICAILLIFIHLLVSESVHKLLKMMGDLSINFQ